MNRAARINQPEQHRAGGQASSKPRSAAWLRAVAWLGRFTSSASSSAAESVFDDRDTVFMAPPALVTLSSEMVVGSSKKPVGDAPTSPFNGDGMPPTPARAGQPAAALGAALGLVLAAVLWWPARWLPDWPLPSDSGAASATSTSGAKLAGASPWVLRPVSGTWWQGQAVLVQRGADAGAAPVAGVRPVSLSWDIRPTWRSGRPGLKLQLAPGCCDQPALQVVALAHADGWWIQVRDASTRWPLEWLAPLGVPVQALRLSGDLWIDTVGLSWRSGHALSGEAVAQAVVRSQLTPGAGMSAHYQARLRPSSAPGRVVLGGADGVLATPAVLELRTLGGALQLTGDGEQTEQGWRFRGTAQASGEAGALRSVIEAALPAGKPSVFSWGKAS